MKTALCLLAVGLAVGLALDLRKLETRNTTFIQEYRAFEPPRSGKPKDTSGAGSRLLESRRVVANKVIFEHKIIQ
ncbi:hypothetical protein [Scytonema sp. HK-05]|uniref:hypothetical protein n=1 Tax=Scytonema sp. HK-05 TaxID=1137095 RepID=UPI0009378900|nr:hypothetical protein [Scytonema sp. HK-05]OKH54320.1 hypothetical protein NIES2130_28985 [Scytonema sp. HK-05]